MLFHDGVPGLFRGAAILLLSNKVGGSCTQVDRPATQETGASEDAPRTATMENCTRESMPFYWGEWKVPVFSLSKPIADVQRPLKAIVEKLRPPVHERRCVLREMS
ncbi:hypothetical protein EMIT0P291_10026 [Pseudomonas sp. IT-P291]